MTSGRVALFIAPGLWHDEEWTGSWVPGGLAWAVSPSRCHGRQGKGSFSPVGPEARTALPAYIISKHLPATSSFRFWQLQFQVSCAVVSREIFGPQSVEALARVANTNPLHFMLTSFSFSLVSLRNILQIPLNGEVIFLKFCIWTGYFANRFTFELVVGSPCPSLPWCDMVSITSNTLHSPVEDHLTLR